MARKGSAVPMKLPSGQVVWVRVEDEEPDPPMPQVPWGSPAYGDAPVYPGAPAYGAAPAYGPAPGYAGASPYPGGSGYDDAPGYGGMPQPGGAAPDQAPVPIPQQWGPPPEQGSYPGGAPSGPPSSQPSPGGSGWLDRFRGKKVVQQAAEDAQQLHGFTEAVSGIAESVRDGLRHAKPDTVEIEFGLDIDVSAGAAISLIADARAKAAVRITLGWDNRERPEGAEARTRVIEGSSEESRRGEADGDSGGDTG
ncbi:hypothetical protein KDL01_27280 [Actinospica durhamensis]|uniref:Trypsin-co-occurring domain-containing protein n=1 Tax=Actinospica durhamensis TaxID=1508375 RepID=A0A941EXV8_9ACTN|nr:CU044_2847 family protein [Actinospica durhamensis]MBR7837009.1 hypothetical protein [Actinospica durhamensis]